MEPFWMVVGAIIALTILRGLSDINPWKALKTERAKRRAAEADYARLNRLIDDWNAQADGRARAAMKAHRAKYEPPAFWKTLGIVPTRDKDTIQKAFRAASKKSHPDRGGNAAAFQAVFEARNAALRYANGETA